ncbi:MAG: type II secretion system protein [Candidatus Paceibacterota bacterium]|jgi:type II secretory pathway pseudopilin PulG
MKHEKGFTLVELAVIVSIIGFMTVLVFSNYGKNNEIFALERASQKLTQDLRRAQEMAMSGSGSIGVTKGFGLYFNEGANETYLFYEDKDVNMVWEAATDALIETITIEKGVKICEVKKIGPNAAEDVISISFAPPDPLTYIGGNVSGHVGAIALCTKTDTTIKKYIKVNNVGMVEITSSL